MINLPNMVMSGEAAERRPQHFASLEQQVDGFPLGPADAFLLFDARACR